MSAAPARQRTCKAPGCRSRFRPSSRTPGQRYCTPSCRKRASDAVRPPKTGSDLRKDTPERVQSLVPDEQSCQIAETAGQSGAVDGATGGQPTAVSPALRKWRRRLIMQGFTQIDRCRRCARTAIAPELGTLTARTEDGRAAGRGVQLCESIWACAVCESAARAEDTHQLTTAALRWLARGGTLAAVVLTTRHTRADALDELVCALWGTRRSVDRATGEITQRVPGAYQRLLTAQSFRRHVAPSVGYIGMARNPEVTRSQAGGWHPHLNALIFLGGALAGTPAKGEVINTFDPTAEDLAGFEDWLHSFWAGALRSIDPAYETSTECDRQGCKCAGRGHGVRMDVIRSPDDKALIEYLTKAAGETADSVQADIESARGAAAEVSYSGAKTAGRRSMTPFQFLDRLWAIERDGLGEGDAPGYGTVDQCRIWWLEYEGATRGRRAFEMTRGLARHTDLAGELEEYRYQEMHRRLLGGVVLTSVAHGQVAEAENDFAVSELVRAEREADVAALVAESGGRADHARVVDGDGCAEYIESLAEVMKAKAKARMDEAATMDRLLERGQELAPCPRCAGSGVLEEYRAIRDGQCFQCGGSGKVVGDPADDDDDE